MRVWLLILLVISVSVAGLLAWTLTPNSNGLPSDTSYGEAAIGGAFTLTDHNGNVVTDKDLLGKYSLVFFGFTHCPDICPTSLLIISNVLEQADVPSEQITPVFISVDPERDTPETMAKYVSHFHPSLIGMTGTDEQIKQVTDAYKVYYAKVQQENSALGYSVDHSGFIYLMDPQGKYVTHYPHNVTQQALTESLKQHVAQN
ncbi:MAG: SCO family protein [Rickettsiales bacterium]|nr:SCO family protein [Rickettsiales bacterium]|tara:strand:- start:380 stop:985 length:606 start_codon:yes stop_codon:yes gene_type:complete